MITILKFFPAGIVFLCFTIHKKIIAIKKIYFLKNIEMNYFAQILNTANENSENVLKLPDGVQAC